MAITTTVFLVNSGYSITRFAKCFLSGRVPPRAYCYFSPRSCWVTEVKWTVVPNDSISTLLKMNLNVFISSLWEVITSIIIDIDLSPSPTVYDDVFFCRMVLTVCVVLKEPGGCSVCPEGRGTGAPTGDCPLCVPIMPA